MTIRSLLAHVGIDVAGKDIYVEGQLVDPAPITDFYDNTVSTRFFRWPAKATDWWRLLLTGHEENCNRTLGVKIPFVGVIFLCLNVPLRQRPCSKCLGEWAQ